MEQYLDKTIADFAREGFFGEGIGQILLQEGRQYKRDDQLLPEIWRSLSGAKKMCYQTSTDYALRYASDLTYVEGYAFSDIPFPFPIAHAWLVTDEGLVVDPTWDSGRDYFGVSFPLSELSEYLLLSREYGILQSLWHCPDLLSAFQKRHLIATKSDT